MSSNIASVIRLKNFAISNKKGNFVELITKV